MITYLKHQEIDKVKWDTCINSAGNGMIYAYSLYLDKMSRHWDALILDNYTAVMPLTWNRKYGVYYLYQPFFSASLGIFGNDIIAGLVKSFLESVPARFKYWDIYLNRGNVFSIAEFPLYVRKNFILDLSPGYASLAAAYSANHSRNIKRAEHLGCYTQKDIPIEDVTKLAGQQSKKFSPVGSSDYANFISLFNILRQDGKAITYGVFNKAGDLVASSGFVFSHSRAYYILVGNHPDGRTMGASHFMIDAFIKDHAGEPLTLDFEGSEIRNLAWFYKGFGATEEQYAAIRLNKLPPLLKLFKK